MNNQVIVNTGDLRKITNNLIKEKNEIMDLYNESLKDILTTSQKELIKSKEDIVGISDELKKLFTRFDSDISELTNLLLTKIIPEYENLSVEIKELFNKTFASELGNLLDINK
ncbi:MAG: hypothetical protein IJI58_02145 [Bacilli bacterium]|nr:hypothetical protein [Bacilli bacterium]